MNEVTVDFDGAKSTLQSTKAHKTAQPSKPPRGHAGQRQVRQSELNSFPHPDPDQGLKNQTGRQQDAPNPLACGRLMG